MGEPKNPTVFEHNRKCPIYDLEISAQISLNKLQTKRVRCQVGCGLSMEDCQKMLIVKKEERIGGIGSILTDPPQKIKEETRIAPVEVYGKYLSPINMIVVKRDGSVHTST